MDMSRIARAVLEGDAEAAADLSKAALSDGEEARTILGDGLLAGMSVVGERFKSGEMFIPEVLMSARALVAGVDVIKPRLSADEMAGKGRVLIGTVQGDIHDIGKNLVKLMLEGAGYEVVDLGVSVSPEVFVAKAEELKPDCIGMSAMLTTTMPFMKDTIDALRAAKLEGNIRTIVGGAPVTQKFADSIGADGYAPDSIVAVDVMNTLIKK